MAPPPCLCVRGIRTAVSMSTLICSHVSLILYNSLQNSHGRRASLQQPSQWASPPLQHTTRPRLPRLLPLPHTQRLSVPSQPGMFSRWIWMEGELSRWRLHKCRNAKAFSHRGGGLWTSELKRKFKIVQSSDRLAIGLSHMTVPSWRERSAPASSTWKRTPLRLWANQRALLKPTGVSASSCRGDFPTPTAASFSSPLPRSSHSSKKSNVAQRPSMTAPTR